MLRFQPEWMWLNSITQTSFAKYISKKFGNGTLAFVYIRVLVKIRKAAKHQWTFIVLPTNKVCTFKKPYEIQTRLARISMFLFISNYMEMLLFISAGNLQFDFEGICNTEGQNLWFSSSSLKEVLFFKQISLECQKKTNNFEQNQGDVWYSHYIIGTYKSGIH